MSSMSWSKHNLATKTKLLAAWLLPPAVVGKLNILLCEMHEKTPKDDCNQAVSARTACQQLRTRRYIIVALRKTLHYEDGYVFESWTMKKRKKISTAAGLQDLPKP